MRALFWETTWGQSAADCNAINQARMNYMHAKVLERQIKPRYSASNARLALMCSLAQSARKVSKRQIGDGL